MKKAQETDRVIFLSEHREESAANATMSIRAYRPTNPVLTLDLAKYLVAIYSTPVNGSSVFGGEFTYNLNLPSGTHRLRLKTNGDAMAYPNCITAMLWVEDLQENRLEDLIPNPNSLMCVTEDSIIFSEHL